MMLVVDFAVNYFLTAESPDHQEYYLHDARAL
jgi:hypothetical protein